MRQNGISSAARQLHDEARQTEAYAVEHYRRLVAHERMRHEDLARHIDVRRRFLGNKSTGRRTDGGRAGIHMWIPQTMNCTESNSEIWKEKQVARAVVENPRQKEPESHA